MTTYRLFGRTGLRVSELFLGTMGFDDVDEARRVVDAYVDAGGNVLDTASAYGESESLIGRVLTRRDRIVLATKYGLSRDRSDPNAAGSHRKNMVRTLERSLQRLRTDHVDVLWVHTRDRHTPVEETMRALDDMVRAGKVLYVGVSDAPAWWIARADLLAEWRGWTPFAGVQIPYGLLNRDAEREVLPMAAELGLTVAAFGVLDHGALVGSGRATALTERQRAAADAVRTVADELGAAPVQVAIAWARSRSSAVHPVVGLRRADQVPTTMAATDLALPSDALSRLDASAPFEPGPLARFLQESATSPFVFGDNDIGGRSTPGNSAFA